MLFKKQIVILAILFVMAVAGMPAQSQAAFNSMPQSIAWPSNSISWPDLQGLFNQYPGTSQFNIQFPNSTQWNVDPSSMQSFYNDYLNSARSLGYGSAANPLPPLIFSALKNAGANNLNIANVPIGNGITVMEQQMEGVLRDMRYEQMHLSDALPDWLKNIILIMWNGLTQLWDFACDEFRKIF